MNIHANIQILMYDYLAGEVSPEERRKIEEHIARCTLCSRECEELRSFNESSRTRRRVPSDELPQEYWREFASGIERLISVHEKKSAYAGERWWDPLITFIRYRPRFAAVLGSSMAVLAVAVSLLLIVQKDRNGPGIENVPSVVTHPVNVDERVGQYLKKSKVLLVGLSNMETGESAAGDLSAERTVSRQLVHEARYLQQQSIDFQAARLIRDLAKIQEDFAEVPSSSEDAALRMIRQSIHRNNLLFKVRMAESVYSDARFVSTGGKKGMK